MLTYLARRQAHEDSAFRDSAPGKIMHETRHGEMANLNEIPFGLYYGGVDTTPLFVALLVCVVLLVGALPTWPHSRSWGYAPSGVFGLLVVILLILLLTGRI